MSFQKEAVVLHPLMGSSDINGDDQEDPDTTGSNFLSEAQLQTLIVQDLKDDELDNMVQQFVMLNAQRNRTETESEMDVDWNAMDVNITSHDHHNFKEKIKTKIQQLKTKVKQSNKNETSEINNEKNKT